LGATTKPTDPFPLPEAGAVTVIQETADEAVHAHSFGAATVRLLALPLAPVPYVDGETSYRHGARCDTRACSPFTTITPSRDEPPSFAATRNEIVAGP
jgi:hypothetical protein